MMSLHSFIGRLAKDQGVDDLKWSLGCSESLPVVTILRVHFAFGYSRPYGTKAGNVIESGLLVKVRRASEKK
jgi:hypothetical protein